MRITGGTFRSRSLGAPRGLATRPTSDRVREALFGILTSAGEVHGARVLDLYAGTGALGLEALSRGAAHATFVESAREALAALRQNVASLGVQDRVRVIAGDAGGATVRSALVAAGPFDLVLADPPWALVDGGDVAAALGSLVATGCVRGGATVVLERASRSPTPAIEGVGHAEDRRYGDATLAFYKTGILGPPRGVT
jgi:16S rRNA (guanine(966)-N(2))-methyltransferase RsmD